ncbi:type I-B CRISPR-associated protein Cas5b [Paenibacillus sp. M1]|uniref:Type I-B CRISPR-associated protein Cas5b n=1 Tax=Paenibacillus haidiansis TaxID=1574488 RepID=A0ABU7VRB3_9BACL
MRAIRFELRGETAFFKKPDVNSYAYFTYSHIHKIALFGLLGAIIGLGGYAQQYEKNNASSASKKSSGPSLAIYPEFYEVLRYAWVSIVPHGDRGYFAKKIQIFNNTVGYASNEEGGVLNVREQWLEHPHWTIYIADHNGLPPGLFDKLADYLLHSKAEYMPYLGKNDHPASITRTAVINLDKPQDKPQFIDSLRAGHIASETYGEIKNRQMQSYFKEYLPVALNEVNNGYILEQLVFTNHEIDPDSLLDRDKERLFLDGERVLYFI